MKDTRASGTEVDGRVVRAQAKFMIRDILSSGWGFPNKLVTFALLLQGAGSWGELYLQGNVRTGCFF